MPSQTDREIKENQLDIIIKTNEQCILIAMTILPKFNTSVKETEKLSKYKELDLEIDINKNRSNTSGPILEPLAS